MVSFGLAPVQPVNPRNAPSALFTDRSFFIAGFDVKRFAPYFAEYACTLPFFLKTAKRTFQRLSVPNLNLNQ
jgi:hypothetical protein|tara:strand:- start:210 stop:425 length:216 start_codon:yes stop_codon:yes gene_type:complete